MKASFPLFILLLLALPACSKDERKSEEKSTASSVNIIPTKDLEESEDIASSSRLECENNECPAAVALFVATATNEVRTCTSFFISDDLLLTNSHCIPQEIKNRKELCRERIHVVTTTQKDIFCSELIGTSAVKGDGRQIDFALLRMKKKQASHFPISSAGIAAKQKLTIYKINPKDGASGILIKDQCDTAEESLGYPSYVDEKSFMAALGCRSINGNSGSPILRADGTAVGILQGSLAFSDLLVAALQANLLEPIAPLALSSSLACFEASAKNLIKPSCTNNSDSEEVIFGKLSDLLEKTQYRDKVEKEKTRLLQEANIVLPNIFKWNWEAKKKRLSQDESPHPLCFTSNDWDFMSEKPFPKNLASTEIDVLLPTIRINTLLNKYLQPTLTVELLSAAETPILFSPRDVVTKRESEVTLQSLEPSRENLSVCVH